MNDSSEVVPTRIHKMIFSAAVYNTQFSLVVVRFLCINDTLCIDIWTCSVNTAAIMTSCRCSWFTIYRQDLISYKAQCRIWAAIWNPLWSVKIQYSKKSASKKNKGVMRYMVLNVNRCWGCTGSCGGLRCMWDTIGDISTNKRSIQLTMPGQSYGSKWMHRKTPPLVSDAAGGANTVAMPLLSSAPQSATSELCPC